MGSLTESDRYIQKHIELIPDSQKAASFKRLIAAGSRHNQIPDMPHASSFK